MNATYHFPPLAKELNRALLLYHWQECQTIYLYGIEMDLPFNMYGKCQSVTFSLSRCMELTSLRVWHDLWMPIYVHFLGKLMILAFLLVWHDWHVISLLSSSKHGTYECLGYDYYHSLPSFDCILAFGNHFGVLAPFSASLDLSLLQFLSIF